MNNEGAILLQNIDCNCNNCIHMERDIEKYNHWAKWHENLDFIEFEKSKQKAMAEALSITDLKNREGMLRVAEKMKFQFDKKGLINYGACTKLNKNVSFLPNICQPDTQLCFENRRSL